jgi:hypothetical protein
MDTLTVQKPPLPEPGYSGLKHSIGSNMRQSKGLSEVKNMQEELKKLRERMSRLTQKTTYSSQAEESKASIAPSSDKIQIVEKSEEDLHKSQELSDIHFIQH